MMLRAAGVEVDKMDLVRQVARVPFRLNGLYGHPNDGFVGSMETLSEPGLGVYHGPIARLADQYLTGRVVDLTGRNFGAVIDVVASGRPVWVVNNVTYARLGKDKFETWPTARGEIQITYAEHSVLVTGYDRHYIYFNDPMNGEQNAAADRKDFVAGWEQMGRQAVSYRGGP
jgi:uncharacterized protein YvpB